jgi:predicted  nucleic acid-binding Zn-ribbon protein
MTTDYISQLTLLRELQLIDVKLHTDRVSLNAIPKERLKIEEEYRIARAEFDGLKNELDEIEAKKTKDEKDLEYATVHFQEREAKLYAIKTQKEYQAAVKEISEAKRSNREREDRILKAMERIEELSQKITQLNDAIADKDKEFETKLAELDGRVVELQAEITAFESRRPAILEKIDKFVIRKYDHIRQRYPDALVPITHGVCAGCSMNIPPQLVIETLKGKELHNCPSCHRLIFVTNEAPAADEAGEGKA